MKATKITESEIADLKVSSLPSRPTAPSAFGGRGYTAQQMKEAFDKLPLYIIGKFNALLSDIASVEDDAISATMPTGITVGHTLRNMFFDITDGKFAQYLALGEETLASYRERLSEWMDEINGFVTDFRLHVEDGIISGGTPVQRKRGDEL
ncbi:MAG: hypothetical protein IKD45_01060 [Clostridia bacterium]|nr:hypothetical protein [Clostridia bacterium]